MLNIAIDGPAGAGKSTIAKKCANKLNCIYVDTGAMYRAMALKCIQNGVDTQSNDTSRIIDICLSSKVTISYEMDTQQIWLDGVNVSDMIRQEEVGNMASKVSVHQKVREHILDLQRNIAKENNVIMDGRDIGTFVLPNANLKIFLTASVEVRAKRRYLELTEKGIKCDLKEIELDIEQRDYRDMNRETAPLKQAEDSILIDSSNMTPEMVINEIVMLARRVDK